MVVCGIGCIIFVFISMAKDKNILTIIEWVENMGTILYITPHSSSLQSQSYFCQGRKNQPSISSSWRYKMYNFQIKWGGWDYIPRHVKFDIWIYQKKSVTELLHSLKSDWTLVEWILDTFLIIMYHSLNMKQWRRTW